MKTYTKAAAALCLALCLVLGAPARAGTLYSLKYTAGSATSRASATRGSRAANATSIVCNGALAAEIVRQVNAERKKAGLSALRVDAELTRAAAVRCAEIAQKFSHTRPDGTAWSTVSARCFGENIARGQRTADKVMAAWMSSSGHRANILRAGFSSIGVCAGVSNGVVHWVQLFGR